MSTELSPQRQIARIAIPVSLEYIVALGLNFINQIIVGGLGAVAIAAVGFANSLTFILVITLSAIGVSAQILVSRAYGARRVHDLNRTVTNTLLFALTVGGSLSLILALWPKEILMLAGASSGVAELGTTYLRLTALTLAPHLFISVLSAVLRGTDHAKAPLRATSFAVILNTVLSYALVYGTWVFPEMGVEGAGWATLISTILRACILLVQTYVIYRVSGWEIAKSWADLIAVLKPVFVTAIPFGLTELVWTLGIFSYNVVLQKLGDEPLAASQISNSLEGVFITASMGLASAASALINREIGAGDGDAADQWRRLIMRTGLYTGAIFGLLYAATSFFIPAWFGNAGTSVQRMAIAGVIVNAVFQVVKVRNMILAGGVLASGNVLRGIIWGDLTGALFVGVPLAIILGLFTPLGFWGVLIARCVDEAAKLVIFSWHGRRIDWKHVALTHTDNQSVDVGK